MRQNTPPHLRPYFQLARATLLSLAFAYVVLLGTFYVFQSHFIYHPVAGLRATPAERGFAYEDLWLTTPDGETLHAWYVPAPQPRGTVLYLHGNGGNISFVVPRDLAGLHALGLNVLLLDYRGYGQSSGTPSEQGLYTDVQTAWDYLTDERSIDPAAIIIIGYSLGGGPAAWLAAHTDPAGLILMNTFTRLIDRGAEIYPMFPVRLLAQHRYPTLDLLSDIHAPLLVVHAADDTTIPIAHGYTLHAAANSPFPLVELEGGHNAGINAAYEQHPTELEAFVRYALGK